MQASKQAETKNGVVWLECCLLLHYEDDEDDHCCCCYYYYYYYTDPLQLDAGKGWRTAFFKSFIESYNTHFFPFAWTSYSSNHALCASLFLFSLEIDGEPRPTKNIE